ncbi:MAG: perR [Firmicutes bacterium]|nr:perR [Bacillota bacterium]
MDKKVTNLLREKGFKVTPQRLAIYKILATTKAHPSAEMIFNQLQTAYPTMSLATVYKTVDILREIGMIQVLNAGEDCFRYDADTSDHPHVRCLECGRVDDLYDINFSDFVGDVAKKTPYRLTGQQFYFYGICPECQKATVN